MMESKKDPVPLLEIPLKNACLAFVSSDRPSFGVREAIIALEDAGLRMKECSSDSVSRLALKIEPLRYEKKLEGAKTIWNVFAAMTLLTLPVRLENRYSVTLYEVSGSFKIESIYGSSLFLAWPLIPIAFFQDSREETYAHWTRDTVISNLKLIAN